MESQSISPSFLCLDKFYKNKNEIKSDFAGNKLLLLSSNFDSLFDFPSKEIM